MLPQLSLGSDVMTDIRNAINAGHEVTTHEHNINFYGWKGAGYIIIDPNNGAGAYLISGGANGGYTYTGNYDVAFKNTFFGASIQDGIGDLGVNRPKFGWLGLTGNATAVIMNNYLGFSEKLQRLAEIITGEGNPCLSQSQKDSFRNGLNSLGLFSQALTPLGFGPSRIVSNGVAIYSEAALVMAYSFIIFLNRDMINIYKLRDKCGNSWEILK